MTLEMEDQQDDVFIRIAPVSHREGARSARVFVSSTFRDMNDERDVLVKEVLPELRKRCEDINVEFSFIDLRWGITDEQVEQGELLPVCLGEIERCWPFFLGLLGEYYGSHASEVSRGLGLIYPWLDEPVTRSVTEIEICAILNHPDLPRHASFYFRDRAYLDTLSKSTRAAWTSQGQDAARLRALKDRIRSSDMPHRDYTNPKALGELVLNDLWTAISAEFPSGAENVRLEENARHRIFLEQHTRLYVGKRFLLERLDAHCTGFEPPLVVRGPAGAGKSALVANWLAERSQEWANGPIFVHSTGSMPTSNRWESLLTRFISWAGSTLGIQETIPDEGEPDELLITFQRSLRAAAKFRPLLVLDGVSELQGPEGFTSLCWLPEEIPEDVRIILTIRDESTALAETNRRGWPELAIGPLSLEERQELVQSALERVGRRLSKEDLWQIVQAPMTEMPLYTRILIQELCTIGRYEKLSEQIQYYLEAESLGSLYGKLFRRWEADYGADVVQRTLVLTAVSRDGLLEQDLLGMTVPEGNPLTSSRLSPLLYSAELEISPRPGMMALTNTHIADAIEREYLTPDVVSEARASLTSYFQKITQVEYGFTLAIGNEALRKQVAEMIDKTEGLLNDFKGRAFHELPWQLYNAGRWEELRELVSKLKYLKWAAKSRPMDPGRWWGELSSRGYRASDAFADELNPVGDTPPEELERIVTLLTETGETEAAFHARDVLNAKYKTANAWRSLGWSRMRQAWILVSREEFDLALEYYREAESAFLKVNDRVSVACTKADLGIALFKRGSARRQVKDILESSRILSDSLRVLQKEGMTSLLGTVYNALGVAVAMQGNLDTGRDYLRRAEHLFRSIGKRAQVAEVFQNRGVMETIAGRREAAADAFRAAARLYRDLGNDVKAAKMEDALARVMEGRNPSNQDFQQTYFKP